MFAMNVEQSNQDQSRAKRKQSITTKLLNKISQDIDIMPLSRELGKSSSEAMSAVLNAVNDMLNSNTRHIVKDGLEVSLWKRKVRGLGKEVVVDIWCNRYLFVCGVWL